MFRGLRSLEGGIFCLVGSLRKDPYYEQPPKAEYVIVVDRYCMYKRNEESMDHLLLHYEVTCAIWNVLKSIQVVLDYA